MKKEIISKKEEKAFYKKAFKTSLPRKKVDPVVANLVDICVLLREISDKLSRPNPPMSPLYYPSTLQPVGRVCQYCSLPNCSGHTFC